MHTSVWTSDNNSPTQMSTGLYLKSLTLAEITSARGFKRDICSAYYRLLFPAWKCMLIVLATIIRTLNLATPTVTEWTLNIFRLFCENFQVTTCTRSTRATMIATFLPNVPFPWLPSHLCQVSLVTDYFRPSM